MPHPTGSPANAAARDYIVSAFHELGIDAQVQEGVGIFHHGRSAQAAIVRNVVARLPGLQGSPAVLLVGHHDSVPAAPGAADDGHSVGVLLETLRALRSGPRLRNDVIFLLTDGEEVGLLGADAFVREHPWAKDVGVVLNFEARGTSGPGHMFETSEGNGWLIRQFAQSAPYPRTDSLSYEVYRRLPNDTDLTVFKKRGYSGLNFAFIDDVFFSSPIVRIETSIASHTWDSVMRHRRAFTASFPSIPKTCGDCASWTYRRGFQAITGRGLPA